MPDINHLSSIESNDCYTHCLLEVEMLIRRNPPVHSPDGERLIKLADMIENYENIHIPLATKNCVDATRKLKVI